MRWDDLSPLQQEFMLLAAEESPLWELTAPEARECLAGLMGAGLIRLFWDEKDGRDLTEAEITDVLNDPARWSHTGPMPFAALYLSPAGEALYYPD